MPRSPSQLSLGKPSVRSRRRARGWTQVDLSVHSGVSQSVISDFERGKTIEWPSIFAIAEALECQWQELFIDPDSPDFNLLMADATPEERQHYFDTLKMMKSGPRR
ncbi:helix-turn-helix domain-containing protein [Acuticoccus sediminis]|uniref:helix-turn-helix domain-containing protein n=1 Tax=Acuticoccus sediminis TaxID=2184697 RepID=UPI001CFDC58D|nr:helix-turn-helix domain-containing protein [Acuticoccus sediminis]